MKLSEIQIEELYQFTRKHFVEYYDLQTELVDHLANGIEAKWQENPNLNFEEVLNTEFKKFGVFGFLDVVEERKKFLQVKYRKLIWKYYKKFFQLPQIFLALLLISGIYFLSELFQNPSYFFTVMIVLLFAHGIFEALKLNKTIKLRHNQTGKKWLFEETAKELSTMPYVFLPPNIINVCNSLSSDFQWTPIISVVCSIGLVLFALMLYVQIKIVSEKISEELLEMYPEYQISE